MSDETRNVTVKLTIDVDRNAPRAFQAFARAANKANKEVAAEMEKGTKKQAQEFKTFQEKLYKGSGTASQLGFSGIGYGVARNAQFAQGLHNAGFAGAGAIAQRMAVPLAVAGQAADLAKAAALSVHDKYSTQDQKLRGVVRDIVPGGEKVQSFVDALSGRAAGYEQADISGKLQAAAGNAENERHAFDLRNNPRQAGLEATAKAYRGQSAVLPSVFDRSTAGGERQYRDEQRILPLKQAQAKAERDSAKASAERAASEGEASRLTKRGNEMLAYRQRLESSLNDDNRQSGASRQETLKRIEAANQQLAGNESNRKAAVQQTAEARMREAEAKGESRKAGIRTDLLGRAANLDEKADRSAQAANSLGGMNQYDRNFAVQAVKMVQQYGWDAVPPEVQQAAMSVAPQTVGKLREQAGAGSESYAELAKIAPEDATAGGPNAIRKQADELRRSAAQKEFDVDKTTAEAVAASSRDLGKYIADIINQGFERVRSEIFNTIRLGRNDR